MSTRRIPVALAILVLAVPASAASLEAGARYVHVRARSGGAVSVGNGNGFSVDAELFWSEALSLHADASFAEPVASFGATDLGTMGINPITLTARWHLAPSRRLSPFVGAGASYVSLGNLDDQFGDAILASPKSKITGAAEAGLRFRWKHGVFVEGGATYIPLKTNLLVRTNTTGVALPARMNVSAIVIGLGASVRF